jgi:gamma-glutamyltranspeptidase
MSADASADVPWDSLLSQEHAHAAVRSGCTSHVSTVDAAGNVVALTQTVLDIFGARVLERESGVLLYDGMMWSTRGRDAELGTEQEAGG